MKIKYVLYLLLFLLGLQESYAKKVVFKDNEERILLGTYLDIFNDSTNKMTIEDLTQLSSSQFFTTTKDAPSFGFVTSTYWAKFKVQNNSEFKKWILEVNYPFFDTIDIYYKKVTEEHFQKRRSGDFFPFDNREIKHRLFNFNFNLEENQEYEFYIRIKTCSSMSFPLEFSTHDNFTVETHDEQLGFGLYYGIVLIMLFYNAFLLFSLRDRSYLYYIIFILSVGIFQASLNGFTYEYLWPNAVEWHNYSVVLFIRIMILAALFFSIKFLQADFRHPKFYKLGLFFIFLTAFTFAFDLSLAYNTNIKIVTGLSIVVIIYILTLGVLSFIRGFKAARFFLLAWGLFLGGMVLQPLKALGLLPGNFIVNYGSQIGSALEILFLALALADKINTLREEKNKLIKKQKDALEIEVKQRTAEILNQKEELAAQRDNIEAKSKILADTIINLTKSRDKVTQSIRYAKRIQESLILDMSEFNLYVKEKFLLYQPRDIVSGDFYWSAKVGNKLVVVSADCTGHGVPGAFVSIVGASLLNQIVKFEKKVVPSEILTRLHFLTTKALHQENDAGSNDGMDLALVVIDMAEQVVHFAGAKNNLFLVKNNELQIFKGNKFPIGGTQYKKAHVYTDHKIAIETGMTLYMTTDGYIDQFGGEDNMKLGRKRFKQLLIEGAHLPMRDQHDFFQSKYKNWKGKQKQIDDVSMVGMRF